MTKDMDRYWRLFLWCQIRLCGHLTDTKWVLFAFCIHAFFFFFPSHDKILWSRPRRLSVAIRLSDETNHWGAQLWAGAQKIKAWFYRYSLKLNFFPYWNYVIIFVQVRFLRFVVMNAAKRKVRLGRCPTATSLPAQSRLHQKKKKKKTVCTLTLNPLPPELSHNFTRWVKGAKKTFKKTHWQGLKWCTYCTRGLFKHLDRIRVELNCFAGAVNWSGWGF